MNVFIINHPEQEELYTDAAVDMEERFGIKPRRWMSQPEGDRQTLQYLMLEGLVGGGPWLILWDDVRFTIAPHRIGEMGDIHLYGGLTGDDPLSAPAEPEAFMVFNNETRRMLADAWSPGKLAPGDAWANVLAASSLTWDEPTTIRRVQ